MIPELQHNPLQGLEYLISFGFDTAGAVLLQDGSSAARCFQHSVVTAYSNDAFNVNWLLSSFRHELALFTDTASVATLNNPLACHVSNGNEISVRVGVEVYYMCKEFI